MIDVEDRIIEENVTSRHHPRNAGVISPAGKKSTPNNTIQKGTIRGEMIPKEAPRDIEKEHERVGLLRRTGTILSFAEDDQETMSDADLPEGTFENIIIDLKKHITFLEEPGAVVTDDLENAIYEIEAKLSDIKRAVLIAAKNERKAAIEQQDTLSRRAILLETKNIFELLKADIAQIEASHSSNISSRDAILHIAQEFSWLDKPQEMEDYVKNKGLPEVQSDKMIVLELGEKVEAAKIILDKEARDDLIAKAKGYAKEFKRLLDEADALVKTDNSRTTLFQEHEDLVKQAENTFNTSLTIKAFLAYTKTINEFKTIVEESKKAARSKISVPPFMSRITLTTTPEVSSPADVAPSTETKEGSVVEPVVLKVASPTPTTVEESQKRNTLRDITIPNLVTDESADHEEHTYKVKIAGKLIPVPRIFINTLKRYVSVLENQNNKGKDFSLASTLKEKVIDAITNAHFSLANQNAMVLGKELNSIEGKGTGPQKSPNISTPSITEPSVENKKGAVVQILTKERKAHEILPTTISQDKNTNQWKKEQNGKWIKMNDQEGAQWTPIYNLLEDYKLFMSSKDVASANASLIAIKNEILDAIDGGNFSLASEKVQPFKEEYNNALKIRDEVRQFNLKKLQDPTSKALSDETLSFAFIKTPQETPSREYRIINRNTGDWVPLSQEDLSSVELSYSVLTNFKIRNSTPPGSIEKKNEVLQLINEYDFVGATKKVEEYMSDFEVATIKEPEVVPVVAPSSADGVASAESTEKILPEATPGAAPLLEKEDEHFEKSLAVQEEQLSNIKDILKRMIPLLTSDLEKKAFARLFEGLQKSAQTVFETQTKESMDNFRKDNDRLLYEISKKRKFLDAQFGANWATQDPVVVSPDRTVMRSKSLRNGQPAEISFEEYTKLQENPDMSVDTPVSSKEDALDLDGMDPRDAIKKLMAEKHTLMQTMITLQAEGASSLEVTKKKQALEKQVADIDQKINEYTNIILQKSTGVSVTDRSASDLYVEGPSRVVPVESDVKIVSTLSSVSVQTESPLPSSAPQHQTSEATPSFAGQNQPLVGTANINVDPTNNLASDPETPNLKPLTEKQMLEEQAEASAPLRETPESKIKKLNIAQKLITGLTKMIKPVTPAQWFRFGSPVVISSDNTLTSKGTNPSKTTQDTRLIDVIQKQPSWMNFIDEKVSKDFLQDFAGEAKLTFDTFMIKHAPSFKINPGNPSALKKLEELICHKVYFVVGADAGITEPQQVESSMIIDSLKEILIAAKAGVGSPYPNESIESGSLFKDKNGNDMTVRQFYMEVTQAVEDAEADKKRIQSIKK